MLEQSLTGLLDRTPHDVIRVRLLAAALRDVEELLPQLEPRAEELAALATSRLREQGEREARDLEETLRGQRERGAGATRRARRPRVPLAGDELTMSPEFGRRVKWLTATYGDLSRIALLSLP